MNRRRFLGLAAAAGAMAALPANLAFAADEKPAAAAKPNSVINGVHIGCITYSYRSSGVDTAEQTLAALVENGLSETELMDGPIRAFGALPPPVRRGELVQPKPSDEELAKRRAGLLAKAAELRKLYNDVTFIDEFLTPEFAMEQKLFSFRYNRDTDLYEIASREFKEIKEKLLFRLTNFGQPFIYVEEGNYNNRGELYLRHRHEGVDLKMDYARDTMRNIHKIWTRPVHLETVVDDKKRLISFDGKDYSERKVD